MARALDNTVLDVGMILSVCSFAIETTFPLSDFKTKHIFGNFMNGSPFGAPKAPQTFFYIYWPILMKFNFFEGGGG